MNTATKPSSHEAALLALITGNNPDALRALNSDAYDQAIEALGLDVEVGDRVRSYDFPADLIYGGPTSYVEGVVEEVTEPWEGCARYKIRVLGRIGRDGTSQDDHEEFVFPPVNLTRSTMDGRTHGVRKQASS